MLGLTFHTLTLLTAITNAKCLWSDSSEAGATWVACHDDQEASSCCQKRDACLSNNLCLDSYGLIYRGACTSSSYPSSYCPSHCSDVFNASSAPLYPCPQNATRTPSTTFPMQPDPPQTTWWCGGNPFRNFCTEQGRAQLFTLPAGRFQHLAGGKGRGRVGVEVPVGIGVGLGIVVVVLAGALGVVLRKERRKRRRGKRVVEGRGGSSVVRKGYGDGGGRWMPLGGSSASPLSLEGIGVPVFDGVQQSQPVELEQLRPPAELEGQERRAMEGGAVI